MTAPEIETFTPEERWEFIRAVFPCLNNCRLCGLCAVFHNRDAVDVYVDYINGTRTFKEITDEYRAAR